MNRHVYLAVLMWFLSTSAFSADEFYLRGKAAFTGGPKIDFDCHRAAKAKIPAGMKELYQPTMGNGEYSYSLECINSSKDFLGISIKIDAVADPRGTSVKAFSGKKPLEQQRNVFTIRSFSNDRKNEMTIHSFPQLPQHVEGAPTLTITEFKTETEGADTFHVIAGKVDVTFKAQKIDKKTDGKAGTISASFRIRPKFVKAPK